MATIGFAQIEEAQQRLNGIANATPVITSRTLDELTGRKVFLKCENFQRGGAFKFRGAYNAISKLVEEEGDDLRGVIAFSSGNHAQGVALAAQLLGVPATICMPTDAPTVKLAATRGYGAEILLYDRQTTDREAFARAAAEERELRLIPPFDHPDIIAGQGTTVLELLDAVPDLDAIVAPIGGGGLISRQVRRSTLRISTVMPIDLCHCTGTTFASPCKVLKYQAIPMLVRIRAAMIQCRPMATTP